MQTSIVAPPALRWWFVGLETKKRNRFTPPVVCSSCLWRQKQTTGLGRAYESFPNANPRHKAGGGCHAIGKVKLRTSQSNLARTEFASASECSFEIQLVRSDSAEIATRDPTLSLDLVDLHASEHLAVTRAPAVILASEKFLDEDFLTHLETDDFSQNLRTRDQRLA
jgi:hypothetical protein